MYSNLYFLTLQILNVKHQTLPHDKSKLGFTLSSSTSKTNKGDRKVCLVPLNQIIYASNL